MSAYCLNIFGNQLWLDLSQQTDLTVTADILLKLLFDIVTSRQVMGSER
jgi:hypothetical protein